MSGFDRSKFAGAKLSAIKGVQKSAQENNKSFGGGNSQRVGFLTIEEGKNVFRILPPHPEDTIGSAYLAKRVAMLKCEVPVYKDGEDTGKTEVKNKNIFIATQHGGLPKDPIEIYIEYVRKRANDEFKSKEDRQKFLAPVTGFRDKKGTWNWGIIPKTSYVAYAVKNGEVGRLELFEQMMKDMNKAAISEDSDDVIEVDPFSDPNEGFELIITKEKQVDKQGKETGKFDYIISRGTPSIAKREDYDSYFKRTMVTDAQLEELLNQEPLSKLIGTDVYSSRDWDLAIDGLRRFDNENGFCIFENEEFLEELQDIEKLVPEYKKDDKDVDAMFEKKEPSKSKGGDKKVVETDEEEVTLTDMKVALKKVVRKQFGEACLNQVPTKESEIRRWYDILMEGEDLPIKIEKEEEQEDDSPVDDSDSLDEDALNSQIAALRNRRK